MHILKLVLRFIPFQLRVPRPRKDEAVEDYGWVVQALLDIFDSPMEQNLLAGGAFVQHAMRLDEGNILFHTNEHPQNEIRVEVARFEESHAFAPAHVPEQEEFHSILFQSRFVVVVPGFQIGDKLILAFVEDDWPAGNFPSAPNVNERLEQVLAEIAEVQITNFQ